MIKIGKLDCDPTLLEDFVRRGAALSLNFKNIHLETPLHDHPCIADVNKNHKAAVLIQAMRDMEAFKKQGAENTNTVLSLMTAAEEITVDSPLDT